MNSRTRRDYRAGPASMLWEKQEKPFHSRGIFLQRGRELSLTNSDPYYRIEGEILSKKRIWSVGVGQGDCTV